MYNHALDLLLLRILERKTFLIMTSHAANHTATAMEAVLNTTELLEHILCSLSMPKILGKSRVCRKWKSVIDGSPAIQDDLFLRRRNASSEVVSPDHWFSSPVNLPPNLRDEQVNFVFSLVQRPVYSNPIELNPLVKWENQANLYFPHEVRDLKPRAFDQCVSGLEVMSGKYNRIYVRHRFGGPSPTDQANSSWHKMYLTTPPITDIVLRIPTSLGIGTEEGFRVVIHAQDGITLGLVRDTVEERLRNIRIKDRRHPVQKRKTGALTEKDYARSWGKQEHVMFIVKDARDLESNGSQ